MVPFPLWVQDTPALFGADVPDKLYESPTHMVASAPASAVTWGLIVITISSVASRHGLIPLAVKVRVTVGPSEETEL